jgi:hypothetical protein
MLTKLKREFTSYLLEYSGHNFLIYSKNPLWYGVIENPFTKHPVREALKAGTHRSILLQRVCF